MGKSTVSLWSKTTRDEPWFLCAPPLISMHGGEDIYATDIITWAQMFPGEVTKAVELF